jgi:hypothetical protein
MVRANQLTDRLAGQLTGAEPVKDRALSPGEEEGIAHLEQLQNAIHGEHTAPQGNGELRIEQAEPTPYRSEVVHITTPESAASIRANGFDVNRGEGLGGDDYGPGVYLADYQRDMGSFWRNELETKNFTGRIETESMPGTVDLPRPFHYEYNRYSNAGTIIGKISPRQSLEQQRPDLVPSYDTAVQAGVSERRALGQTLREAGYDGLVVEHRAGDEIIAFDAKHVQWAAPKAAKPVTPQPPPAARPRTDAEQLAAAQARLQTNAAEGIRERDEAEATAAAGPKPGPPGTATPTKGKLIPTRGADGSVQWTTAPVTEPTPASVATKPGPPGTAKPKATTPREPGDRVLVRGEPANRTDGARRVIEHARPDGCRRGNARPHRIRRALAGDRGRA